MDGGANVNEAAKVAKAAIEVMCFMLDVLKVSVSESKSVALGINRFVDFHVLMGMLMLYRGKTETVWMISVLVAMQLREQEVHPRIDDGQVGGKAKSLE